MSNKKDTKFNLYKEQAEFMFGIPESRFSEVDKETGLIKTPSDICCYQGGQTCVPEDTEYLSPRGWVSIKELDITKELAVYYPNGAIKFEKPKTVFRFPADEWYIFDTRFTKQCLCPNHKIVYFNDKDNKMESPKFIKCKDFVDRGCNSHYKLRNYFKSGNNNKLDLTEFELRLLVAYQADGYDYQKVYKHKNPKKTLGFHLKKKNKIERLISILDKTSFKYTIKERQNGIKKGFADIFVEEDKGLNKYKHFTPFMYSLNDEQLSIIFDEVKYWDCSHKNAKDLKGYGTWTYSSHSKEDRDFVQFVCASQGYCTTCYERTRDIKISHPNKIYEYKNSTEYTVSWTKGKPLSFGKAKKEIAKGGDFKFCPSTSTGMWLARYKNFIFVTGNS